MAIEGQGYPCYRHDMMMIIKVCVNNNYELGIVKTIKLGANYLYSVGILETITLGVNYLF